MNLGVNSLWALGAAIVLTTVSVIYYQSQVQVQPFRKIWHERIFRLWVNIGFGVFCLGLVGTAEGIYQKSIWTVAVVWFVYQAWILKS